MAPAKIKRSVRVITEQALTDEPADVEGFFIRTWSVQVCLLTEAGEEMPANIYKKVVYNLHPSFGKRQFQTMTTPPFKLAEKGWGEFVMKLQLHTKNDEVHTIEHDLLFHSERYPTDYPVEFKKTQGEVGDILRESEDPNAHKEDTKKKSAKGEVKKKDTRKSVVDMDHLAVILPKLGEEDLLKVVQMIEEDKTPDVYIKNDHENGTFHVDLYTLPETTVKKVWDFSIARSQA